MEGSKAQLHVGNGAKVVVSGAQEGSISVDTGGHIIVEPKGKLAGSIRNAGRIDNHGLRAGSVSGTGDLVDHPGSEIKSPTVRDDITYYRW